MIQRLRPDQILARPDTIEWAIALQQAALSAAKRSNEDIVAGGKEAKRVAARIEVLKQRLVESRARNGKGEKHDYV